VDQSDLNRKAYMWKWEDEKDPHKNSKTYWFCGMAKDAAYWDTQRLAELATNTLNRGTIPSIHGGLHVIQNFEIEEFGPDSYVMFHTTPFIYTTRELTGEMNGE
jgi:hypothetical protein